MRNLRRGHLELGLDAPLATRLAAACAEPANGGASIIQTRREEMTMRFINRIGDRLLARVVPGIRASAEPCGPLVSVFCYCSGPAWYSKKCCQYSGSCYPCKKIGNYC